MPAEGLFETMNPVVHFEIPSDDRDRATSFYASVFEWDIEETPFEDDVYTSVITSPIDENYMHTERGAINGAIIERNGPPTAPIITIEVPSIDVHVDNIEEAGGSIVVPKGEVPEMGYYAYFEDTEGNVIGLWESMGGE